MEGKLNEERLFDCLKSLNVPVRLSDIRTPTKDFMINVIYCFLKDNSIDITSPVLRPWSNFQHLENPEISENALTLMLMVRCINMFMPNGTVMYYRDIVDPKPKRTRMLLNHLVFFWQFAMKQYLLHGAVDEELEEEKEKIFGMLEENKTLEEKYNSCLYELQNMNPSKGEIEENNLIMSNQIEEFDRQKEIETNEYQDLKKREHDLKARIASVDVDMISKKEKISELDQCILTSPERFTDDISKQKELIKNEELKIKEKEAVLKEKQNILEALKLAQEENEKVLKLLQQLEEPYDESYKTANLFCSEYQKNKQQEDELKKLKDLLDKTAKSTSHIEDKLIKVQLNLQMQSEKYNDQLKTLQSDAVKEQENLHSAKSSVSLLEQKGEKAISEAVEIVSKYKEAELETNKAITAYKTQEEDIVNQFEKDCTDVKNMVKKYFEH